VEKKQINPAKIQRNCKAKVNHSQSITAVTQTHVDRQPMYIERLYWPILNHIGLLSLPSAKASVFSRVYWSFPRLLHKKFSCFFVENSKSRAELPFLGACGNFRFVGGLPNRKVDERKTGERAQNFSFHAVYLNFG
jgi:hypothetical protein